MGKLQSTGGVGGATGQGSGPGQWCHQHAGGQVSVPWQLSGVSATLQGLSPSPTTEVEDGGGGRGGEPQVLPICRGRSALDLQRTGKATEELTHVLRTLPGPISQRRRMGS